MSRRLSPAKERLLVLLKMRGPMTTDQLAEVANVTPAAVRQHLGDLEAQEIVTFVERRGQVGRPARRWQLGAGDAADGCFPDSHADLTVTLLRSARTALGDEALDAVLAARTDHQAAVYGERVGADADLGEQVATLADIRTREGYMAEWSTADDGGFRLVENHCPICTAATECRRLCRSELDLFQRFFGPDVTVERNEYLLDGDRRCAYAIRPV